MSRMRDEGAAYAYSKSDGSAYVFGRNEFSRLKSDWMAGKAFFEGTGFYGSPVIIKLGDIVALIDESAESMAAGRADKKEDARQDAIDA